MYILPTAVRTTGNSTSPPRTSVYNDIAFRQKMSETMLQFTPPRPSTPLFQVKAASVGFYL